MKVLFICGATRSGTTYAVSLFDGHPQLLTLPYEFQPFTFLYSARKTADALQLFKQEVFRVPFDPVGQTKAYNAFELDTRVTDSFDTEKFFSAFLKELASNTTDLKHIYTSLANAFGETRGASLTYSEGYLVVKYPFFHEIEWARLRKALPNARFIHIVRHPIDRYNSLRAIYHRRRKFLDWKKACENYIGSAILGFINQAADPQNYRIIRFEDLRDGDRAGIMKDLAQWLGISYDEILLQSTVNGYPRVPNSSFTPYDTKSLSKKRPLPLVEKLLVSFLCSSIGEKLGYKMPIFDKLSDIYWRRIPNESLQQYILRRRYIRGFLHKYGSLKNAYKPVSNQLFFDFLERIREMDVAEILSY